jgi:mannose-6-phosphate isomerase-like protein (cupin superfamily)
MTPPSGWTVINNGGGTNDGATAVTTGASGAKSVSFTAAGYTITQFNTLTYPVAGGGGQTVTSVTGSNITEASSLVFDVAMAGSGDSTHAFSWGGTATSADYTQTLTTAMCSVVTGTGTVTVTGSNVFVPGTATAIRITVPTTTDALDENGETVILTLGGTASNTVTIADDDAEPSITGTTSVTVDAGDPTVITYTLSAVSGRTITRTLTVTDGTATGGGVDYTSTIDDSMFATTSGTGTVTISGSTVTIPAGVGAFTLTIPTTA